MNDRWAKPSQERNSNRLQQYIAVRIGQGPNLPYLAVFRYPLFKAFVKTGPAHYIYPAIFY
jgi:hypothetical protein